MILRPTKLFICLFKNNTMSTKLICEKYNNTLLDGKKKLKFDNDNLIEES